MATAAGRRGGPLRVGACLSLSGRYARFGSQAVRCAEAPAGRRLDGTPSWSIRRMIAATRDAARPATQTVAAWLCAAGPYSTQLTRVGGDGRGRRVAGLEPWRGRG